MSTSYEPRDDGGEIVLDTPDEFAVVVPAGHVVDFVVIGGGGAGGNWGGTHGRSGTRVTGIITSADHDRTFVLVCGEGGQVDPTVGSAATEPRGPALGGRGGSGDEPGGVGGWGADRGGDGGGGGGGSSSVTCTDGSVKIVAAGGGGGGGGSPAATPPGERRHAVDTPARFDPPGALATNTIPPPGDGFATRPIDGGNGRSRHRVPGGGGGGGGGGTPGGAGGDSGRGGRGSAGEPGRSVTNGVAFAICSAADETDPDHGPGTLIGTPGAGGRAGSRGTGSVAVDPRVGYPGSNGRIEIAWAPAGWLGHQLLNGYVERPGPETDAADLLRADRVHRVVVRPRGDRRQVEEATIVRSAELIGQAVEIWDLLEGSASVREAARRVAAGGSDAERLDIATRAIVSLEESGLVTTSTAGHAAPTPPTGDFGFGYDLVGDRYPLLADPTGRPGGADLLCAAFPENSPAGAALRRVVRSLRGTIGDDRVIWALKHVDARLRFEFYLFAAAAAHRRDGLRGLFTDTVTAMARLTEWTAPTRFDGDPILVSFEFDIDDEGVVTTGSTIDTSYNVPGPLPFVINYEVSAGGSRLKSMSQGFDLPYQRPLLAERLGSDRRADARSRPTIGRTWLERITAATECERCWVSVKATSDGVYLSRTRIDDLVAFLEEFSYPEHLRRWVAERATSLDHLRYDLCFDYAVTDSAVSTNRTAFCSWF